MKSCRFFLLVAVIGLMMPMTVRAADSPYTLSGPYVHANLQIFLIHGKESIDDQKYITLTEAMQKKVVVVHETGNVQQLSIENTSKDTPVYIQSGDIVKGGRQDRVISLDVIIPPRSGKLPLNSFCVESGRWSQRGSEKAGHFAANSEMVSSKQLRMAAKYEMNQGSVWSNVAEQQKKLNENIRKLSGKPSVDVTANASGSSLQLTLENKELQQMTGDYLKELESILEGKTDVLGFAFLINGEINNADVYGRSDLFQDLWPKLLKAAVVEAISEYQQPEKEEPAGLVSRRLKIVEGITALFTGVRKGEEATKDVNARTRLVTRESKKHILFETRDRKLAGSWLHRNYIKKDPRTARAPVRPAQMRNNEGLINTDQVHDEQIQQKAVPNRAPRRIQGLGLQNR